MTHTRSPLIHYGTHARGNPYQPSGWVLPPAPPRIAPVDAWTTMAFRALLPPPPDPPAAPARRRGVFRRRQPGRHRAP
jgi:hypothetical protein